jgi:hypothetical protein
MPLSIQLLNILVCPVCHGRLDYQPDQNRLVCQACKVAYPVSDEIPVLLADEGIPLK